MFYYKINCSNKESLTRMIKFNSYPSANRGRAFKIILLFVYNQHVLDMLRNISISEFMSNGKSIIEEHKPYLQKVRKQLTPGVISDEQEHQLDPNKLLLGVVVFVDLFAEQKVVNQRLIFPGTIKNIFITVDQDGVSQSS